MNQEFYLSEAVDTLIKEQKIVVKKDMSTDKWFGITYPEDKPLVMKRITELIDDKKYSISLGK